jgi:hypothetical protein
MEVFMLTSILSAFAFGGALLVYTIFVIASLVAVAICFAACACQIMLWIQKYGFTDNFVNNSCFLGALTGLVWSIVAINTVGLGSAFLSVLALCALILFAAWAIWFADGFKPRPIPDWA